MQAAKGDTLVVKTPRVGSPERTGMVVDVRGPEGEPPFVVRWSDGHESLFMPGPDALVEHRAGSKAR